MLIRKADYKKINLEKFLSNDLSKEVIYEFLKDDLFLSIILCSSEDLYNNIIKYDLSENDKIFNSIIKYLIRMSSRTTPYALMGSILTDKIPHSFIETKLSISWKKMFAKFVTLRQPEYSHLKLYINTRVFERTSEFVFDNYSISEKKLNRFKFNKSSPIGKKIKEIEKASYVTIEQFYSFFKNVDSKKILTFLVDNDILISELELHIDKDSHYFIEQLRYFYLNYSQLLDDLDKNLTCLSCIPFSKVEKFPRLFFETKNIMDTLLPTTSHNKIPKFSHTKYEKLCGENLKILPIEVLDSLEFLRDMNFISEIYSNFLAFCTYFEEKYGKFVKVNLLEMLKNDSFFYEKVIKHETFMSPTKGLVNREKYSKFWENKIIEAVSKKNKTIKLDDTDIISIRCLLNINNKKHYSVLTDIKFQEIDDLFYLPPVAFAFPNNSYSSNYSIIKNDYNSDMNIYYDINYQLKYFPDIGYKETNSYKQINLNYIEKENQYNLSDLYVGLDEKGLFLEIFQEGKIVPVYRSLAELNYICEDGVVKFLKDIGICISTPPLDLNLGDAEDSIYIPRIMYKNIILRREMWNIIPLLPLLTKNDFYKYLDNISETFEIPNIVVLYTGNSEIPINRTNKFGQEILYKEYRKANRLILFEFLGEMDNSSVTDYISSYVLGNEKFNSISTSLETYSYGNREIKSTTLLFENNENLVKALRIIKDYSQTINLTYFYTYYIDSNKKSIRLRYHENYSNKFIDLINKLKFEKIIHSYFDSEYIFEAGRFGGENCFNDIINFFSNDSLLAVDYISGRISYVELIKYLIRVLYSIFNSMEYLCEIFSNIIPVGNMKFQQELKQSISFNEVKEFLNQLSKESRIIEVSKLGNYLIETKCSTKRIEYTVSSLVHMCCNRRLIIGEKEEKIYSGIYQILKQLKYLEGMKNGK